MASASPLIACGNVESGKKCAIASNRHQTQPGMHSSWCQYRNKCKAWLPGMTVADIYRQNAA